MNSNNEKISLDFSYKEDIIAWAKSKNFKVPVKLNFWYWLLAFALFVLTGPLFPLNFIGYGVFIFYRTKVYRDKYRSLFKKWIDAGKPKIIKEVVSQGKIQKLKVEEEVEEEVEEVKINKQVQKVNPKKDLKEKKVADYKIEEINFKEEVEEVKINKQMPEMSSKTGLQKEIKANNNSLKEKKNIKNQDQGEKSSKKITSKEVVYKDLKNGKESSSKILPKDLSPYEFSKEEVFQASVEIAIRRLIITSPEKVSLSESERDAPAKYGWEFGHFILKNSTGKKMGMIDNPTILKQLTENKDADLSSIVKTEIKGNFQVIDDQIVDKKNVNSEFGFTFVPSVANIPEGFKSLGDPVKDLKYALKNQSISFRSFFNDCEFLNNDGSWKEETLFCPPFDEVLFCKTLKENHRKEIAEKNVQRMEKSKKDEQMAMLWGGLAGIISGGDNGLMKGAMLGNYLRNSASLSNRDPNVPVEDFLEDPSLKFSSDPGSYISLAEKYRTQSLKRRICLKRVFLNDDKIYFDLLPMVLFENYATPGQIFKLILEDQFKSELPEQNDIYCFRPISAGFDLDIPEELKYNPIKIRRSFSYNPKTDIEKYAKIMQTTILGNTIEKETTIYHAWLKDDPSMQHFYFDYSTDGQLF